MAPGGTAGNEPARETHFDDSDHGAAWFRAARDWLRSFNFCMGLSIGSYQRRRMRYPRYHLIASSIMGFEDR